MRMRRILTQKNKRPAIPRTSEKLPASQRAADRVRTGDPELGKLVLYQLSYHRVASSLKVGARTRLVNEK